MDWTSGLQSAIDYIEDNITKDLSLDEIAKCLGFSSFYFQRIFTFLCGFSLGEYIRNRRLTLAGEELLSSNKKVIDIALKYGYESPESFSRAFQKFHGILPSEARKAKAPLNSFSRLSVEIKLKGGSLMNYKVVKKDAFTVIEKVSSHTIDDSQNINTVPAFWSESKANGTLKKLLELTEDSEYIFGICYGNTHTDKQTFDYSIATKCNKEAKVPKGFRLNTIPARTWIIFECEGAMPNAIQELWHKICSEFFPTTNYEPTYEVDIEAYTAGDMSAANYKSQIWIPVIEK